MVQVESERGCRNTELFSNEPCIYTGITRLDQQTEDSEAGFVTQSGQAFGGGNKFHGSSIVEMSYYVKRRFAMPW
jgi:hypothetical protein